MTVDTRYSIEPSLQQLFRDTRTGLPLANGYVLFFRDDARTIGKEVFQITGASPNYTFTPYGFLTLAGAWRVDLTAWGAFQFPLYYFPFDSDGASQLYYIEIYANDDTQMGSAIEAWPALANNTPVATPVDVNLAPNGQFLLHTDIVDTSVIPFVTGKISKPITDIAYGGWTFERPSSSTATDIVTFERFGSPTPDISQNPRYALRVQVQAPDAGDTFKDICLKYLDVNKFASTTQIYTYAFTAVSNSGASLTVDVILKKNYGTGGSTQTETSLGTFTVTTAESIVFVSFVFGDNSSKTIGLLDDDYLQLCVRLPVDTISDSSWTDAIVTPGTISSPVFPVTPDSEMIYQSLAGFIDIPAYDGSQAYLPLILTPTGISFDQSSIGSFLWTADLTPPKGFLATDGNGYQVNTVSSDGIPYSRLANKWYNNTLNIYKFGTGSSFATSDVSVITALNQIRLSNNTAGSVTNTADGTPATGFTFTTPYGGHSAYNFDCYFGYQSATDISVEATILAKYIGNAGGTLGAPSTNVAGWVIYNSERNHTASGAPAEQEDIKQNYSLVMTSVPVASDYVYFEVVTSVGALQRIMLWFKINGSGTQPVSPVADVYIELDLLSTYNVVEVGKEVNEALNGRQISTIVTVAGSSVPVGSNWTFNTPTAGYYVWYTVNGVGTDPMVLNRTGIKVPILSTDSDSAVCSKTVIQINKFYVGVPSTQGTFIRIYDVAGKFDEGRRISTYSNIPSSEIGTFEVDSFLGHVHAAPADVFATGPTGAAFGPGAGVGVSGQFTQGTGWLETRPYNLVLNLFVKY